MTIDYPTEFRRRVLGPRLNVRSGVYTAIDPALTMRLTERGEYEYSGLDDGYTGPFDDLLKVSAFGGAAATEEQFASRAYPASEGAAAHPIIGHYRGLFAGHVVEGQYRANGSSGGVATWMLVELLRTRRVDGVIHLVPTRSGGTLFEYRISRTVDDVREGAKSRYYPGQLGDVLTEIATAGERFALTAIPSFAYEVRLLQDLKPGFRAAIPYVIGLVCGHQKSANYAQYLAWRAGIDPAQVDYVDFRRKVEGRPANKYTTEFRSTEHGQPVVRAFPQEEILGTDWGLGFFKTNFSDFTEDIFNETADIVLGDAWLPRYTSDSAGTNIVITRHAELHELIESARDAGRLHLEDQTESEIMRSQSSLVRHNVDELPMRFSYLAAAGGYTPTPRRGARTEVPRLRRRIQILRYWIAQRSNEAWPRAWAAGDLSLFDAEVLPLVRRYQRVQRAMNSNVSPRRIISRLLRALRAG
ncbi:MAG TPA: Coenzyme F420 hydrogenase/dehydrogenase, beta subunit C-terminal domain [Pseudolysinimonas sp.]|nr:Coenzyme F420 hydrogenase/dehydrogenase, beta subunit C-terminal domain [Pseudolysinimonas sp.]